MIGTCRRFIINDVVGDVTLRFSIFVSTALFSLEINNDGPTGSAIWRYACLIVLLIGRIARHGRRSLQISNSPWPSIVS